MEVLHADAQLADSQIGIAIATKHVSAAATTPLKDAQVRFLFMGPFCVTQLCFFVFCATVLKYDETRYHALK